MGQNEIPCADDTAFHQLQLRGIDSGEGVTVESHIFLVSQLPCCAQIALPYWAKIAGRIKSGLDRDVLIRVVVTLFDKYGSALSDYTDMIALDKEERGEFEVKLTEYHDRAETYAIAVYEAEQL